MHLPRVVFSSWMAWSKRDTFKRWDLPGVYLLAHFDRPRRGPANPQSWRIIYIGETCNRLRDRWVQFHHSAFEGKNEHSGGMTYRRKRKCKRKKLYVAAFPVDGLSEMVRPSFIRYVERKLLLDFVLRWRRPPECNLE